MTRFARLPQWQLRVYMVASAIGIVAAIANVAASSSNGARALHAGLGLACGGLLVIFVRAARVPAEE